MISLILVISAIICFILAAIPAVSTRINLIAVGLACWSASTIVGRM